jgi:cell division transport system permease protein
MNRYFFLHAQSAKNALVRIIHQPFGSLLSLATLALAFILPLILYLSVMSVQDGASRMSAKPQITVFMALDANDADLANIHQQLKRHRLVEHYTFVGKNQALTELEHQDGMAGLSSTLPNNPLPDVFVVTPTITDPERLLYLQKNLSYLPSVHETKFDLRWAKRLHELVMLGKEIVGLISVVFGLVLVLITYNIIYMQILSRKEEIVVSKLIGASNYFIRRSFFYHAFWQSCIAAIVAWLGILWFTAIVNPALQRFADLYHAQAMLRSVYWYEWLVFAISGVILSLLGARLAVGQHLRKLKLHT